MSEEKDEWYVSRSGQRFGPVTFAEMQESAKAGRLEPRTDMVIGGGLTEWKTAGEVDGLFARKGPGYDFEDRGLSGDKPPKDSLADSGSFDFKDEYGKPLKFPGAPRLGYFLGVTVLPALIFVGLTKVMPQIQGVVGKEYAPWAALLTMVIPLVVVIAVTVKRFQNLAMNGAWFFGMFVPFLNWWLGYRLFACPPAYALTKKLDGMGKVLAVIFWMGPVLGIVAGIMMAGKIKELEKSGELEDLINQYQQHIPKVPKMPKKKEAASAPSPI